MNIAGLLTFSSLSALISVVCMLFAPLIIGRAIDGMVQTHGQAFAAVTHAALLLLFVYLCSNIFLWLLNCLTNRISYRTVNRLRKALFDKIEILPLEFYDRSAHGDTVSRFVNDVDIIADGLLQGFMALLQGVFTIVGAIVFMLLLNPAHGAHRHALRTCLLFHRPLYHHTFTGAVPGTGRLPRPAERLRGRNDRRRKEPWRLSATKPRAMKEFRGINAKLYETGVKSQFISSLSNPSTRVVNNIAYAVVGVCGSLAAIHGSLTAGGISSFLIYAVIFAKPFNDITNVLAQMQSAAASAQRVFHILDLEAGNAGPGASRPI